MKRLLVLVALLFALPALSATYYVDCAASNDRGAGTSPETAWQTIDKVNRSSFKPGDSILFKRGCTWRETLEPPSSGANGTPITFSAYGSGPAPIISGADVITGFSSHSGTYSKAGMTSAINYVWFDGKIGSKKPGAGALTSDRDWYYDPDAATVYIYSSTDPIGRVIEVGARDVGISLWQKSYLTLDGLHVDKNNSTFAGGICVDGRISATDVTVKNCLVTGTVGGIYVNSVDNFTADSNTIYADVSRYTGGLTVNIDGTKTCTNYKATNNTIHDVVIGVNLPIGKAAKIIHTGVFSRNTIHNVTNNGFSINDVNSVIFEYNEVYDGGTVASDTTGIHLTHATNCIVRYNLAYNWCDPTSIGGNGIQIDVRSDNTEVYYNVCYGNGGAGISVISSRGVLLFNNTSYGNCRHGTGGEFYLAGATTTATIKNNIGFAINSYAIYLAATIDTTGLTFTDNDWYRDSGKWYYDGLSGGDSLATWNAKSYVGTDLSSDPEVTNASSGDLTLRDHSPCIDAGANLGSAYSTALMPGSSWPSGVVTGDQPNTGQWWEVGAYLFPIGLGPTPINPPFPRRVLGRGK